MRMPSSRERSAVRAENRPPRLAQAASSTKPASAMTPSKKGVHRAAERVAQEAGLGQAKARALVGVGILFASCAAILSMSAAACAE